MEEFFVREGWVITVVVLLYAILTAKISKNRVYIRLAVPLVISFVLHTIHYCMRTDVDTVRYISDIFYDYFAPIGIYRFAVLVKEHIKNNRL